MESFLHLRKGTTPRRVHADLDGLKDDELSRAGFTGRSANFFRRHDPTAYRAVGPLRPIDVLADQLRPADATDPDGLPLLLFSNPDCRVLLSRRTAPMPRLANHASACANWWRKTRRRARTNASMLRVKSMTNWARS